MIANFLGTLEPGWIGLDSGTGNGKYLSIPDRSIWMIGLDRSRNLLEIAKHAGSEDRPEMKEVVWGDVLDGCWRNGVFVSIAIHAGCFRLSVSRIMLYL